MDSRLNAILADLRAQELARSERPMVRPASPDGAAALPPPRSRSRIRRLRRAFLRPRYAEGAE